MIVGCRLAFVMATATRAISLIHNFDATLPVAAGTDSCVGDATHVVDIIVNVQLTQTHTHTHRISNFHARASSSSPHTHTHTHNIKCSTISLSVWFVLLLLLSCCCCACIFPLESAQLAGSVVSSVTIKITRSPTMHHSTYNFRTLERHERHHWTGHQHATAGERVSAAKRIML